MSWTRASIALLVESDRLGRELTNLTTAVASGGGVPSLVAELRKRESCKREIERLVARPTIDREALHATLAAKLEDWKGLLRSRPTHGQRVLRTVFEGAICVGEPTAEGVPWEARGDLRGMLKTLCNQLASQTFTSSDPLVSWLRQLDALRQVA